ncbi:MAG: NADH-quinone oxidoreductase subunit N [Verrucomicrobia bacterium]|nr:MAG: NADH-quinone oxidoreductase subunit N [Verrucomicrobiota bacterium]
MNTTSLEFAVVGLGILLLLAEAFIDRTNKDYLAYLGAAGLSIILFLSFLPLQGPVAGSPDSAFLTSDILSVFFTRFLLLSTIVVLLMSPGFKPVLSRYLPAEKEGAGVGEFTILPLFVCAGLMWMVSAIDFIMIFVALELATITLYVLSTYLRQNTASLEAGTKFLILGALSTGFFVYGITWIFGVTGTTNITTLPQAISTLPETSTLPLLFGVAMILVALSFKIGAFPFQFWVPDVYQGAPTPVTAYLSVASKAAGFVVLLRLLVALETAPVLAHKLYAVVTLLAGVTLIFGNLAAIPQTNMKRLLGYSSVAHAGYLLMGVASLGSLMAIPAIGLYFAAYLIMTLLSFVVLMVVAEATGGEEISRFNGLSQRSPLLAGAMLLAMASLAGIPFTAGFVGKFLIFEVALKQGHFGLVAIGCITVAAGFYYYFKVARAMYWQQPTEETPIPVSMTIKLLIALLGAGILALGIYPGPVLAALR